MRTHCPLSMSPIKMAFTRMPSGPSSLERAFMSAMPAARETELGSLAAPGALAAMARVKSAAPLLWRRWGSAVRVNRTAPITLSCRSPSHTASSLASRVPAAERPALCTMPSILPHRATAPSTRRVMSAACSTSARTARTSPPAAASAASAEASRCFVAPADGHRGTLRHESLRQGQSEAVGPTGDQHDLPRQFEIH